LVRLCSALLILPGCDAPAPAEQAIEPPAVGVIKVDKQQVNPFFELAKERREDEGLSSYDAAVKAGHQRFRAVMMTALSFLLGIVSLVIATGAGAGSRVALGNAVFGGTLAATVIGTLLIPVMHIVVQSIREKVKGVPKTSPVPVVAQSSGD
jgi:predicted RND superfamily exporter protein